MPLAWENMSALFPDRITPRLPGAEGGVVVDLSCGSGLMTRRLCRSGRYRRVLALDYSEAMLRETGRRFDVESAPRHPARVGGWLRAGPLLLTLALTLAQL